MFGLSKKEIFSRSWRGMIRQNLQKAVEGCYRQCDYFNPDTGLRCAIGILAPRGDHSSLRGTVRFLIARYRDRHTPDLKRAQIGAFFEEAGLTDSIDNHETVELLSAIQMAHDYSEDARDLRSRLWEVGKKHNALPWSKD